MRSFKVFLIVACFQCVSCLKTSEVPNNGKLQGLFSITYSNNDNYQEIFIKDSLASLADEDIGIVYRQLDLVDDSIKLYQDLKIYLAGKVNYMNSNTIEITFSDFKSELIRIDKYLLSDSIMKTIIEGVERNEVTEQLWWERFRARKAEWLGER